MNFSQNPHSAILAGFSTIMEKFGIANWFINEPIKFGDPFVLSTDHDVEPRTLMESLKEYLFALALTRPSLHSLRLEWKQLDPSLYPLTTYKLPEEVKSETTRDTVFEKPKHHRVTIRNRVPGKVSTGGNTIVELDGQPLKMCRSVKYECEAGKVSKITIELYGEVEIDIMGEVDSYPTVIKEGE